MKFTAGQIAELLKGEIVGDEEVVITHPGKIENAGEGAITFLANPKYKKYLKSSEAAAVLVPSSFQSDNSIKPTLIKVENVYMALGKLLDSLGIGAKKPESVSDNASIDEDAQLGTDVTVGDYAVIQENVEIGDESTVFSQVYIGKNVSIGKNCTIYPGARIHHDTFIGDNCVIHSNAVIGSDGFGFAADDDGRYHKIPQIGKVLIKDNVEIGANVVIDRATMGETLINAGVKLDNLIQIAHNVTIGENTVIAAQAGIAGSSDIGKNVVIGGQAGIVGHISIADGTKIQAQSGIAADIDKNDSRKYGTPALNYNNYLRSYAVFKQLPDLKKEVEQLRKQLDELKSQKK